MLDFMMPQLDGEVPEKHSECATTGGPTGRGSPSRWSGGHRSAVHPFGVTDFLTKPVVANLATHRLSRALRPGAAAGIGGTGIPGARPDHEPPRLGVNAL
jgi:hypothetical protein